MRASPSPETVPSEGPRSIRMWAGLTVGPIAWVIQLYLDWGLSEVIACAPATEPPPTILGVSLRTVLLVLTATLFGVTVASGVGSWTCVRARDGNGRPHVEDFLAVAGVMTAVLFSIVIAAGFLPIYLAEGCLP